MGNTFNTGRLINGLFVDASGNVGINNTSPSYRLSVNGDIASIGGTYYLQRSSASAVLPIIRYWNGTGSPMTGGTLGDILTIGTQGTNDLLFATDNSERMRISSSGNVGIGINSPSRLLHLNSSGDTYIRVDSYNGTLQTLFGTDDLGTYIGQQSNNIVRFITNSAERMRITNTGRVGIGTSSPVGPLDIAVPAVGSAIGATNTQQAYDYSRLRIKHYTDSNLGLSIGYAGANYTYIQACYNEGTAAPLFINPFGSNTAVGTTSARARLDVGGAIMTLYQASTIADKAAGIFCESTGAGLSTGFGFVIQDGFAFQGDNAASNRKLSVRKPTANGSLGDLVAYIDSAAGNSWFAGRMERTGQPSFQAHRTAGENQSITASVDTNIIIFNGTIHNTGSHYNTANGRFTAPVTGRYMFASTCRFDGTTSGTYIRLYFTINGASGGSTSYTFGHVIAGPSGYSSNYHSLNTTAVLSLNSGDYVEVRAYLNSGSSGIQYESQFSGFLI